MTLTTNIRYIFINIANKTERNKLEGFLVLLGAKNEKFK